MSRKTTTPATEAKVEVAQKWYTRFAVLGNEAVDGLASELSSASAEFGVEEVRYAKAAARFGKRMAEVKTAILNPGLKATDFYEFAWAIAKRKKSTIDNAITCHLVLPSLEEDLQSMPIPIEDLTSVAKVTDGAIRSRILREADVQRGIKKAVDITSEVREKAEKAAYEAMDQEDRDAADKKAADKETKAAERATTEAAEKFKTAKEKIGQSLKTKLAVFTTLANLDGAGKWLEIGSGIGQEYGQVGTDAMRSIVAEVRKDLEAKLAEQEKGKEAAEAEAKAKAEAEVGRTVVKVVPTPRQPRKVKASA